MIEYHCPVAGCQYSTHSRETFIGHMAGTMQSDPAHRWENVPIGHHNLEPATVDVDVSTLGDFQGGEPSDG